MGKKQLFTKLIIVLITVMLFLPNLVYANQYRETTNIDNIDENRYPGYKEKLKQLKNEHPNWNFTFLYTGLDWNTVIEKETTAHHGRSLVQNKFGEWLCHICGTKVYDGSNWRCASIKAVSYYLDPRNFLNSRDLFQFETLSYVEGMYTEEGIEAILNGTFMSNKSIKEYYNNENYIDAKFSTILIEAGKESGVSPYHLASRIKQEIIVSGGGPSNSVTGTVEGYEGYYNFFNIGATSGEGAVERGLKYAISNGWNTPDKSIKEGAKKIAVNYISRGQNTLYLEKFDVDDSDNSLYSHQYQQNIQAPTNEGRRIYDNTYSKLGMLGNSFNFVIPLYENMPKAVSELPREDMPNANGDIVRVIANGSLKLRSQPTSDSEMITYIPTGTLLTRLEKNVANANGFDWDKVQTASGKIGYVASKYIEDVPNNQDRTENKFSVDEENVTINCEPKVAVKDIKDTYSEKNIIIKDINGTEITDIEQYLGTGMQIIIDNKAYNIVKYGDINGDGIVKASDYVLLKNHIMEPEKNPFDDIKTKATDVNKDGSIKASDYVLIKNYLMGGGNISI